MAKIIDIVHQERAIRFLANTNCQDIDEYLKRTWIEGSEERASYQFINSELICSGFDVPEAEGWKGLYDRFKEAINEFEKNPRENHAALRKMFLEREDLDEEFFFHLQFRPKMIKLYPVFVPRGDDKQADLFWDEVTRMWKEICRKVLIEDDEEAWNCVYPDSEDDDLDDDEIAAAMGMMDFDDDDMDDEEGMYGFTVDDIMELAAQGVAPWDDNAGAVLDALNEGFRCQDGTK